MTMPRCPVCGQSIDDPRAAARVHANLERLRAADRKEHDRQLAMVTAKAARDAKLAANEARRAAEAQARTRLDQERRRYRAEAEAAAAKARTAEQRRTAHEIDAMKRQIDDYRRRLEKMTADERGEISESEIVEVLRAAFPFDKIERLGKGRGSADIRHEVIERGKHCGVIVYECKNVRQWSNGHVAQARKSRTFHHASHVVLVSNVFPKGTKYLCFVRDVPVVHPTIVTHVVRCLRHALVVVAASSGSASERERRADRLLQYVKGEDFTRHMTAIGDAAVELRMLQVKERQTHNRVWEQQATAFEALEAAHQKLQTRLDAIVSGTNVSALPELAAG
jgi:hypothetical protein